MNLITRWLAIAVVAITGTCHAAGVATYDAANNTITLPTVKVANLATFKDVVIQLNAFGAIKLADPLVGAEISFEQGTNTLRVPTVTIGGASYRGVSIANLLFSVVSFGGVVIDAGTGSNYNLDMTITAAGMSMPPIKLSGVPKPSGQLQFCVPEIYQQFQQNLPSVAGTWSITSCSFDGTKGQIGAKVTISNPITFSTTYSISYVYSGG